MSMTITFPINMLIFRFIISLFPFTDSMGNWNEIDLTYLKSVKWADGIHY